MSVSSRGDDLVKLFLEDSSTVRLSNIDLSSNEDLFRVCQCVKNGASKGGKKVYHINLCKLDGSKCSHLFEAFSGLQNEFSLDISYNNLGPLSMSNIAQILAPTVRLINLTLDGTNIGNSGVAGLSASLHHSQTLQSLYLADNGIGKEGMRCLSFVIPKMERLTLLNISGNDMSDESSVSKVCIAIKGSKIRFLNMSLNKMTEKAIPHLAQLLNQNRVLESLNVACNALGDNAMEHIGKSLVENVVLRSLNLSGTQIGPIGATRLAKCLELNDTLQELDLSRVHHSHISIGVDGAVKFADMLTLNRGITTLNLYWQCIGNRGAAAIALAMNSNRTITKINLGGNYISPEGVRRLETALGISENIRRNQPITAWRESSPITPLLLNRSIKNRRPSTVGPGRRSIGSVVERSASSGGHMPVLSPKGTFYGQRPSVARSSTMSLIGNVERPSSQLSPVSSAHAFFDNKFTGETTPSILTRRPTIGEESLAHSPPLSPSTGGGLSAMKMTPMLAGLGSSLVHRIKSNESMDAERAGDNAVDAMRNVGQGESVE